MIQACGVSVGRRKRSYLSLFSGCGGLDLGFHRNNFRCAGAFEMCPAAAETYRANLGGNIHVGDLSERKPSEFPQADVVIAGPPCQGFSTAGKRNPDDPRNSLLLSPVRVGIATGAKVVVIENVVGVNTGKHARYWSEATALLASSGYRVSDVKCNALDFGVPQQRQRYILLAWNTGFDGQIELPQRQSPTLRRALTGAGRLPNHFPVWLDPGSDDEKISKRIRQHQKLSNVRVSERAVHTWQIPEVFGRTNKLERQTLTALLRLRRRNRQRDFGDADPVKCRSLSAELGKPASSILRVLILKGYVRRLDAGYDLAHTFNGKFRRLSWDHPASTVDTRFGNPRYFLHPVENRGLSVREAARIQGFPDNFTFYGSMSEQFRMVGNAVPPPLADSIACFVKDKLLKRAN